MDGVISAYVSLIAKLEEEQAEIPGCMQGELLDLYQQILKDEKEKLSAMLKTLM